jgi:hypothetical protein
MRQSERLTQFEGPEGAFYFNPIDIVCVGPDQMSHDLTTGAARKARQVWLTGGASIMLWDGIDLMSAVL